MDVSKEYIEMCDCEEIQAQVVLIENGFFYYNPIAKSTSTCSSIFKKELINGAIWLPRQDQLQEMLKGKYDSGYWMIWSFYEFCMGYDPYDCFPSMEQLWLAFVMKEKYNKQWKGEWR